ncbi:NAD(P)/FAD-dependent oxidoreductase [Geomesophilobacter sediminis]|uniref:NAD(P)/FAD-dependent oxidoreductase n=1 Tax=Geomesophilobacter sediminis TaxID=2798584 RepID=A0A8J7M4F5_9BACT|nr:NAD(P)/FAD-dependent oxidoreductase [Geomesophilobacter sediminis]MBJ6727891.1 NAD(P)/FAD-dependent oxidoreductase [Geomesophilobacter sediminis]
MPKKDIVEKGAILQRDRETYAIAPHTPGGFVDTATLRRICDVADKYQIPAIKLTSAQRIALLGIREEEIDAIWAELDQRHGAPIGLCVRSVKICPGTEFCKRAVQDSVSLGLKVDALYHSMPLPNKAKFGISGCLLSCSETHTKDIGMAGTAKGWRIMVGGNGGPKPRLADILIDNVPDEETVLEIVAKVVDFYKNYPNNELRLGRIIDAMGIEAFRTAVLGDGK